MLGPYDRTYKLKGEIFRICDKKNWYSEFIYFKILKKKKSENCADRSSKIFTVNLLVWIHGHYKINFIMLNYSKCW